MHSFIAYIDESGDEGFRFGHGPGAGGSSEWFVLAACVVREQNHVSCMAHVSKTLIPIESRRNAPVHFTRLPHEARTALCGSIGKAPCKIVAIAVNKKTLPHGHSLRGNRRLYFYYTRYLLERISWVTRDHRTPNQGNGFCKLVFARAKNLSYGLLRAYLLRLKGKKRVQIDWTAIDVDLIEVQQPGQLIGLRLADACASGVRSALELSDYGYCEDRYVKLLKPALYCNGNNYLSYGMKIVPVVPDPEPGRDNRYAWIQELT